MRKNYYKFNCRNRPHCWCCSSIRGACHSVCLVTTCVCVQLPERKRPGLFLFGRSPTHRHHRCQTVIVHKRRDWEKRKKTKKKETQVCLPQRIRMVRKAGRSQLPSSLGWHLPLVAGRLRAKSPHYCLLLLCAGVLQRPLTRLWNASFDASHTLTLSPWYRFLRVEHCPSSWRPKLGQKRKGKSVCVSASCFCYWSPQRTRKTGKDITNKRKEGREGKWQQCHVSSEPRASSMYRHFVLCSSSTSSIELSSHLADYGAETAHSTLGRLSVLSLFFFLSLFVFCPLLLSFSLTLSLVLIRAWRYSVCTGTSALSRPSASCRCAHAAHSRLR